MGAYTGPLTVLLCVIICYLLVGVLIELRAIRSATHDQNTIILHTRAELTGKHNHDY